jgi:hypothetical protein
MKKIFVLSVLSCSFGTTQLFGDTKAFEQAVSQYCKGGKTNVLAQAVINAMQGWKAKDKTAANTFTVRYSFVKQTLELFLVEVRAKSSTIA